MADTPSHLGLNGSCFWIYMVLNLADPLPESLHCFYVKLLLKFNILLWPKRSFWFFVKCCGKTWTTFWINSFHVGEYTNPKVKAQFSQSKLPHGANKQNIISPLKVSPQSAISHIIYDSVVRTLHWMNHKLESRLPRKISTTSDMQMIPL